MPHPNDDYHALVQAVARMTPEGAVAAELRTLGLEVLHVMWEDSARYKGSAVGPNISDLTIQVHSTRGGDPYLTCMPVIRFPNFADRTCDLPLDAITLHVGNERGEPLRPVSLRDYLGDLRRYLTRPHEWPGDRTSLLAPRDTHVLVSAQACFLPIPREGLATFTPVLFNYQSTRKHPAVLAILVTREGTSATVIDNFRDAALPGGHHGQRLLFNANGRRAPFTGTRTSDADKTTLAAGPGGAQAASAALLIQIPLVCPANARDAGDIDFMCMEQERGISDVEPAVIGHGPEEGDHTEIGGFPIERDERFPIRVTVQFYKATSNGALDEDDVVDIAAQIERVYADARSVGSLVTDGDTGRPTEWDDQGEGKLRPPRWWGQFWRRYAADHGLPLAEAYEKWFRAQRPLPDSPETIERAIAVMYETT